MTLSSVSYFMNSNAVWLHSEAGSTPDLIWHKSRYLKVPPAPLLNSDFLYALPALPCTLVPLINASGGIVLDIITL